jgi:hypothetical protein
LTPGIPLQRFGTEAEVSAAIVYLLSPAASYITGSRIRVDGGAPNARRGWWDLQPAKYNVASTGFTGTRFLQSSTRCRDHHDVVVDVEALGDQRFVIVDEHHVAHAEAVHDLRTSSEVGPDGQARTEDLVF